MRRSAVLLFLIAGIAALGFGQAMDFTQPPDTVPAAELGAVAVDERLQLAVADGHYPVTPGDVYGLSFLQGIEMITLQFLVESDYSVNLGILGKINARGQRFAELKPQIEAIFSDAYPRSLPSLTIVSIGLFQVTLSGAIPQAQRVIAWGMSRLSDVVVGVVGPYTSLRRVTVVSGTGARRSYDVFLAVDQGQADQDPLLGPGDSVSFTRRGLVVGVQGQVYEPGSYELVSGEGLSDLRQFFQGFTPNGDVNRLVVQRQSGDQVRQIPLGSVVAGERFNFENGDVLIVPSRVVPRQVVFVEGAVEISFDVQPEAAEQSLIPVYNRITRELTVGDTLYSLLLDIQDQISPFADIERGYVIRQEVEDPIRINMREVLYRQSEFNDFVLLPFDRIVIPLDQPYVIVSGDVSQPARYPYNPSADYAYYLNFAGTGAESFLDVRDRVNLYDRDGVSVDRDSVIQPGFTIHVRPHQDRFVVISGDVPDPGTHLYDSSRDYVYYLRLSGVGAENLTLARNSVEIYDEVGVIQPRDTTIQPGFTIYLRPPEDVILPEGRLVVVSGDVPNPGAYPHVASRNALYYLRLSGVGAEAWADIQDSVEIYDETGAAQPRDAAILPEYTVFVPTPPEVVIPGTEVPGVVISDGVTPEPVYVLVTGAVSAPGLQQLTGARLASYYIHQAGGVNREVSADGAYVVTDSAGNDRPLDAPIAAGDTIEVLRNGFVYNFSRFFPIITTGLAFITTIITLVTVLNQ